MESTRLITAEDLARMGRKAFRFELVRGRMVRMNPTNSDHGRISLLIGSEVRAFVHSRRLGTVMVETGYTLSRAPDTVRGPDVSFVRAGRPGGLPSQGFVAGPPDLAVEVKSPDDTIPELMSKATEYLSAGAELVWIVDPGPQKVTVLAAGRPPRELGIDDALDGGETLPGFALRVAEVFEHGE